MAFSGIIYRRLITNYKGAEVSYISQSCDPAKRNSDFLNLNVAYSGVRIENARKKKAQHFGLQPPVFSSWILAISGLRNFCCRH